MDANSLVLELIKRQGFGTRINLWVGWVIIARNCGSYYHLTSSSIDLLRPIQADTLTMLTTYRGIQLIRNCFARQVKETAVSYSGMQDVSFLGSSFCISLSFWMVCCQKVVLPNNVFWKWRRPILNMLQTDVLFCTSLRVNNSCFCPTVKRQKRLKNNGTQKYYLIKKNLYVHLNNAWRYSQCLKRFNRLDPRLSSITQETE